MTQVQTTRAFMRALNITRRGAAAACTGQDSLACAAMATLCELWMVGDARGRAFTVEAMHSTLHAVQPALRATVLGAVGYIVGDDRLVTGILTACERGAASKLHTCGGLSS